MRFRDSALALIALLIAATSSRAGAEWQSLEQVQRAAEQHVEAEVGAHAARMIARAESLDPRLKLAPCTASLEARVPFGDTRGPRVTVEVACPAAESWRVYVPVALETFGRVVVAARPLPRDTVLTQSDVVVEERPLGALLHGYVVTPADAVGLKLRRAVPAGAAIVPSALASPPLVERGQLVTLKAASGGISVAMTGTALEAGVRGAVIDVENRSSGRRVQAVVRSRRVVEVLLQ